MKTLSHEDKQAVLHYVRNAVREAFHKKDVGAGTIGIVSSDIEVVYLEDVYFNERDVFCGNIVIDIGFEINKVGRANAESI